MEVIFHGDDFGLTPGINEGIIRAFREGLLSSTSIVASGEAFPEAIRLARKNPELDLGIHLTLCDERPFLAGCPLASVVSKGNAFPSRRSIAMKILTRSLDYRQVEMEWRAQIEAVRDQEILISHMDGHQFVHLFPGLWNVCLRLAEQYEIPFVRASIADPFPDGARYLRYVQWLSLKLWSRIYLRKRIPRPEKAVPCIGFCREGGRMDRDFLLLVLCRLKPYTPAMEVMLHPGSGDAHTCDKYRHWGYRWNKDLDLLLDPKLKEGLARRRISVTSFRALARKA